VKRDAPRLSFLILSEDSAPDACKPIEALVKRMLLLVDPVVQTQRIEFEPRSEEALLAMQGTNWKAEPNDFFYPKLVLLGRIIAAKLLEEEDAPGFERARTLDEDALIQAKEAALVRLLRLTPFWCIEAWLYQNTALVHRLCKQHCGAHLDQIKGWAADRGGLDEIPTPKTAICVGSKHNAELSQRQFPAEAVFAADKSFAAAVMALLDCPDLCAALARTWA